MITEVFNGVRLALRRWPRLVVLAGMITVASAMVAVAAGDVLSQFQIMRGGTELRERHAVTFTPYYRDSDVAVISSHTMAGLVESVEARTAYTAVISNVEIDNPDFAAGRPAVLLFGDELAELYPDLNLCSPAPCGMRGALVPAAEVAEVEIAGRKVSVDRQLAHSATFFDVNAAGLVLDHAVVLLLPADLIPRLDLYEQEELIWRTVLLEPGSETTDDFVDGAAGDGLMLVPHHIARDQPQRFGDLMQVSASYLTAFSAFGALIILAFASSSWETFRRESRSFAIHRVYGASVRHLVVRVGAYLAATLLVLPLLVLVAIQVMGEPVASGARLIAAALFAIFIVMWAAGVKMIYSRTTLGRGQ